MQKSMPVSVILVMAMSGGHAMAQGSGSSRVAPPSSSRPNRGSSAVPMTPRPPTIAQFAASFWRYMNDPKAPYRKWGTPGKMRNRGEQLGLDGIERQMSMAHHQVGQTYLNGVANRNSQRLPLTSVLAREAYAADGQTIENIAVMYRAKGADPKTGNWYWIMYRPDGSLARTPREQGNREIAGRVQICIDCHRRAGGNDYVFLNDRRGGSVGAPNSLPQGSGARR